MVNTLAKISYLCLNPQILKTFNFALGFCGVSREQVGRKVSWWRKLIKKDDNWAQHENFWYFVRNIYHWRYSITIRYVLSVSANQIQNIFVI